MADGSIAVFDTKYFYNRWRPITAIWNADLDDNHWTDPDPTWLPLIATPPFPSFSSAHAALSGAARAVLERAFGKHGFAITLTNPQLGLVLNYTSWKQITDDIDDARVYGGIHFRFDQEVGAHQGRKVGKYILRNFLALRMTSMTSMTIEAGRARFVEEARRVHLIRNEGSNDREPVACQLTPFQAARRLSEPAP